MKRILLIVAGVLVLAIVVAAGVAWHLHRRALPDYGGTVTVQGPQKPVEILRDQWGTPHIFAASLEDAAFAEGWAVAQDRLFQLELLRRLTQGRLAEIFGPVALDADKLNRTIDLQGEGRRILERASPRVKAIGEAYNRGVNAYVEHLGGKLPIEFTLLGIGFAPLKSDDLVGILPYMSFSLMDTWRLEPFYERLAQKVGPERFARLFPDAGGGSAGAYPPSAALDPAVMSAGMAAIEQLGFSGTPGASNNWVVGPKKSAGGKAILSNDPHLGLALPAIWYTVHLSAPGLDVAGVTIPGFPTVSIGHNRDIAWGLTNLMADNGDFFREKLNPDNAGQVMFRGKWVHLERREETIRVKGQEPVKVVVRITPHGPIVSDLMPGQTEALSMRWTVNAATDANDLDGFLMVNEAHDWTTFRAAIAKMGGIAQNFAFADKQGNIGVQAGGRIPLRQGVTTGNRYRVGWDGSQEWSGFVPFDRMPKSYNPAQGWIATANTSPFGRPAPFYLTTYYEPQDRWLRIGEVLRSKEKLSVADMQALQSDRVWLTARELAPKIRAAYAAKAPDDATERAALKLLDGWSGDMATDSTAAAVFANLLPNLFLEIYSDELSEALAKEVLSRSNLQSVLIRQVLEGQTEWLDRTDTPQKEGWPEVIRGAFAKTVAEMKTKLGGEPATWTWGKMHTFEATHPLGRVKWFAPYFNRGPTPVAGSPMTVGKMQYPYGTFAVNHGASMRQITDFGDINNALVVLPGGESGIPASRHYA
ncbi:MAG TPA: penicillin acylase family protein, partial [bacterium]